MNRQWIIVIATLLLADCGGPPHKNDNNLYGEMENLREYGTVVSVKKGGHLDAKGVHGAVVNNDDKSSPGIVGSIGNFISSDDSDEKEESITQLEYVIRMDNGKLVTIDQIPDVNESVVYSGQRAMIQMNGKYLRVYPADVEYLHP
jgi:outer membrane lipoprotein SlyB